MAGARDISTRYTLGEELGRGGFGTVFACRDSETGGTVAVKRIGLRNLNKDSLTLIEQEVRLLKKLDHPNIVKYIGTVRTDEYLHIVLEYMENGSLARNLKLFGALGQSLCALYIRQVLNGLAYLHEQGVIHRDIKGANILTTKQGLVKLADFGVATHTSAQSNEVVGTPYWMAPEIIEMSGPTTACDIWSVGCTIIELLTLKPPYFDIPPMAALYRIVQDEYPPLPEGLSPALREFLLLCFKKEPLLRSSANDLLRHRWVHKPRGIQEPKFVGRQTPEGDPVDPGASDGAAADPADASESNVTQRRRRGMNRQASKRPSISEDEAVFSIHEPGSEDEPTSQVSEKQRTLWRKSVMNTIRLSEEQRAEGLKMQKEADERERRDGPRSSAAAARRGGGDDGDDDDDEEDWDDWDQEGPEAAAAARRRKLKAGKSARGSFDDDDDDDDDEEEDEDEDEDVGGVEEDDLDLGFDDIQDSEQSRQLKEQFRAMVGSRGRSSKGGETRGPKLSVGELDLDDLDGAFGEDTKVSTISQDHAPSTDTSKLESRLERFRETDDSEDGFLGDIGGADAGVGAKNGIVGITEAGGGSRTTDGDSEDMVAVLKRRMIAVSNLDQNSGLEDVGEPGKSRAGGEDYSDPFLSEFEDDDERDFVEDEGRSLVAQQTLQVEKLISKLRPDQDDQTVLTACAKLTALFREQPAQRRTLLTHHGVIPIMEMLEMSSTEVLHAVLKVVGQIIENDREFQELLSLAGLIPIVAKFCRPDVSRPIRLQAASLVKQFLKTSNITLQMLVACGGIPILAGLLVPCVGGHGAAPVGSPAPPDVALACVAVDGIQRVFELSSLGARRGAIPKNDFCRLLAKEGVLFHLVGLLQHCRTPQGEAECAVLGCQASELVLEIADVLLVFSHGDSVVKQQFADHAVLQGILRTLTLEAPFSSDETASAAALRRRASSASTSQTAGPTGERAATESGQVAVSDEEIGPLLKSLLKCIKNLCMEPSVLETLESAGAIPSLVPFLAYCSSMSKLAAAQPSGGGGGGGGGGKALPSRPAPISRGSSRMPGRALSSAQEQLVKEIQNLVMLAMFYLCRLSRSRQEQAAISGVIPFLMDAVATRSAVKTVALLILTDLAHTSDLTRDQLWRCDALDFYLDLLVSGDLFWQEKAFTSLGAWLSSATPEVERYMLRPRSLQRLVALFQSAQTNNFENYVKELLMMLTRSQRLTEAIGRSGLFMAELVARLSFPKAEVRINLLKMLKVISERHEDLEYLVLEHNLFAVVSDLAKQAEDSHRVLVMEIANQLLDEWRVSLQL